LGTIAGVAYVILFRDADNQEASEVAATEMPAPTPTAEPKLVLEELRSYQLVAEITTGTGPSRRTLGLLYGWFEVPHRTRWEFGPAQPANHIFMRTEDGLWTYAPNLATYTFQPGNAAALYADRPQPFHVTYLVGSILPSSTATDEAIIAAPKEDLLGRVVAIVEAGEPLVSGTRRLWVDVKNRMVLKEEVLNHPTLGAYEAAMVEFSLNKDVDDEVFAFVPPPGARQTNAGPTAQSNPGPLFPTYLPTGYQMRTSATSATGTQFQVDNKVYDDRQGHSFILNQEYRKEPWSLAPGELRAVGRYEGRVIQVGAAVSLSWIVGEIRLGLTSSSLSADELVRIASSMR
jgi:outer membrane lipoprotein-sorting protein